MLFTTKQITSIEKAKRVNLVNSITGIKPANLIGTISESGKSNLAIFTSIVHLTSKPPFLGFFLRPMLKTLKHTYLNIKKNGFYTINHVQESCIENAHRTSIKFPRYTSEFDLCNFTTEFLYNFKAPFVKESLIKMGMHFIEEIKVPSNNCLLIVGKIEYLIVPNDLVQENGYINLAKAKSVGISGCNSYYKFIKLADFPYKKFF